MTYLPWAQLCSNAWHEVGHYINARACGLAVTCMTIDQELARRESGQGIGGFCTIPALHRAPLFDQITVYRADIVAADLGGFENRHGGGGELTRHLLGDDQRAMVARAARRAEAILRAHLAEAEALVERSVRERTIRFATSARQSLRGGKHQRAGSGEIFGLLAES